MYVALHGDKFLPFHFTTILQEHAFLLYFILSFHFNFSCFSPDAGIFPTFQVCYSFSSHALLAGMLEYFTKVLFDGVPCFLVNSQ